MMPRRLAASAGEGARLPPDTRTKTVLVQHLRQLIEALDRRVPHVERAGEAAIARDARALKERALKRLAELGEKE